MRFWHLSDPTLVEYADGDIEPRQQAVATAHLAHCRKCAARLKRIQEAAKACEGAGRLPAPAKLRHLSAVALRAKGGVEISCERAAPLLQESVDGSLSPFAAVVLQQHLSTCAPCRRQLAALASAARVVRALPLVDSPAEVRARVRVASQRAARPVWGTIGWRPVLAGAAAALVIGAFSLLRPVSPPQPDWRPVVAQDLAEHPQADTQAVEVADLGSSERPPSHVLEAVEPEDTVVVMPEPEAVATSITPAPRLSARLVSTSPKGPSPAPVTLAMHEPRVTMPTAFAALRAVKAASDEAGVRHALELAGERFATLRSEELSEATLVQLPVALGDQPEGAGLGPSSEQPRLLVPMGRPAQPDAEPVVPSEDALHEGAYLLSGPFA
ncbi:MAG: zf-HC2 domain-containing protein [Armatimonadetes bacterium]|nr:zf-HC2 domain-containing protein [Armatimonadota bacterium]